MPPFNPRARYPQGNVRMSIPSLSGGVGRQAPTKRAVNEAENIDNALVTLERSIEKRSPLQFIRRFTDNAFDTLDSDDFSRLDVGTSSTDADLFFHWFSVSDNQRYLCVIDYSSNDPSTYFSIYRTTESGFYKCNVDAAAQFDYLTYGYNEGLPKNLKAITIGPQLIVLNSNVKAGYTSTERTFNGSEQIQLADGSIITPDVDDKYWCKIDYSGEYISSPRYLEDTGGRKIIYYTTIPVDPQGEASIFISSKFYVRNDQVFYPMPAGTDLGLYLNQRYSESGSVGFADILDDGTPSPSAYQWTVLSEDIPRSMVHFHMTGIQVIFGDNDPSANTDSTVTVTFNKESARDKWLTLDKFFLAGQDLPLDSGYTLTDNGSDKWNIVWTGTADGNPAYDVAKKIDDGWTEDTTVQNEPYEFRGVVLDFEWPTSLNDYVADPATEDYTLTNPTTIIFNCIQEGIAENSVPAYATDAGANGAAFNLRGDADGGAVGDFIPVEDWDYPEAGKAYLGQALEDFSEFNFPPDVTDVDDTANGPTGTEATETLAELYPEQLGATANGRGGTAGTGKVYYVENSYAGNPPGFYIVRNATEKPYLMLVRSPYEYSVIDRERFPKIVKITDATGSVEDFALEDFELEHRVAGDLATNPGPAAFKEGLQAQIQSMAFFRDRLFLSVGDSVFSSRTGDFSDFWVQDPSTVQETDPIDVRLSTNKYAPVATMTPFQQYLFINTESDIQFTLNGSENKISPLNAEVSPTAFYSTSPLVDPILLGSQIYFFAPRRTYIYFNDATVSVNQAIETSLNCPDYLPTNFGAVTVVPGYDSILMLDEDNAKHMYLYTNRYSGGKVSQNAFFRYKFRVDIAYMESFDNNIYYITRQPDGSGGSIWNLNFQKFREEDYSVPLLDQWVYVGGPDDEGSVSYDSGTDTTTFTIPKFMNLNPEFIYVVPQESDPGSGEVYQIDPDGGYSSVNGTVTLTFDGDVTYENRRYVVGTSYTMSVELSPQYMRGEDQNMIEGVVSLRTMSTQHFNTGQYRVEKDINGRRSTSMTFTPQELDAKQYTSGFDVPLPLYEAKGETFSKIMGFSADTSIFIVSDYPSPCNITQIELKGRFTGKSSGFVR